MSKTTYTGNISQQTHFYATPGKYEVKIDDAVTTMAFGYSTTYKDYTKQITNISQFGDELTAIGSYCFYYCDKLSSINFEDSNIQNIGTYAFRYTSLSSLYIPSQITSVGAYAFANISTLNDISVSPDNTYFDCHDNSHALINKSTKSLLFASNQTYHIPTDITSIGAYAFSNKTISSITIPSNIVMLGLRTAATGIFAYCNNLISIELPNSLTVTSFAQMFRECTSLVSVDLPNNFTNTGAYSFYGDISLQYVRMPNALTAVSTYAFADCTNDNLVIDFSERTLTSIPSLTINSFYNMNTTRTMETNFKILVPESLLENWKTATNWTTIADHIVSSI